MGASDSKLVFKKGIFRLSEERNISSDDPYWTSFWELPETTEDVFSLFSPADIRRTRDQAPENLETLIAVVVTQLFALRHHPSFPDLDQAPERDALNCIRVLTRVLPYVYEADHLHEWEEQFFWGPRQKRARKHTPQGQVLFDDSQQGDENASQPAATTVLEDAKPLAEELIDTLIDLLFFADFTLPSSGRNKVSYAIWQSGVGCNTPVGTSKEFESNRTEILRLLLTLTSKSMYMSASMLPVVGVKAITYIATCPDKQVVLSVLCSLLNTTLKYNPASWRVPYNHMVFKDPRQILVTYALQFLLVILLYPIPESGPSSGQKNYYRHFLGRLHRPQDFQFIVDGMTRILNQPVLANTSYLPGSQASTKCAPEMIQLFWEITQANKRFRSFIIDTARSHDFVVLIIFYAIEYRLDAAKQGVVRMCVFILQTLSVEANFGTSLNKRFEAQETLPPSIRVPDFHGTYADFLIHSIYSIISTSQGKLMAVYPALLAVIANIAGYITDLSPEASSKLLQLFASMSSPSFLLANDSNHNLLHSLLESMNAIIEHNYKSLFAIFLCTNTLAFSRIVSDKFPILAIWATAITFRHANAAPENPNFIYSVLRNKKRFEALRSFTLESGQAEIERRNRRRKENLPNSGDSSENLSRTLTHDDVRSPSASDRRSTTLTDVPEEGSFAIGGDDDDDESDDEQQPTPAHSTPTEQPSRASSVSSAVDDAVPVQVRGMSEKARGKMPAGTPTFARQSSTTSLGSHSAAAGLGADEFFEPSVDWIESWLPELPLHTILTMIQQVAPLLPRASASPEGVSAGIMRTIENAEVRGIDPSPLRVHSFEWSPLSLGWYESLLWSFVFTSEMQVSKGTVGVWNGTAIRLFRVQEAAPEGPSLTSPRGAVDAVGSNIVSRIGSINLRRGPSPQVSTSSQPGSGGGVQNRDGPRSAVI